MYTIWFFHIALIKRKFCLFHFSTPPILLLLALHLFELHIRLRTAECFVISMATYPFIERRAENNVHLNNGIILSLFVCQKAIAILQVKFATCDSSENVSRWTVSILPMFSWLNFIKNSCIRLKVFQIFWTKVLLFTHTYMF